MVWRRLGHGFAWVLGALLSIPSVFAHCPLCTIGAAAAAGGALWLGINKIVVAMFLGAFAFSMGWWFARLIKKKYMPFQFPLIVLVVFLLTFVPILPMFVYQAGWYVHVFGAYGSMLNRVYLVNVSLWTGLLGALIVLVSPWLSKKLSGLRKGKVWKFQGVVLTLVLLVIVGAILQLVV